MTDLTPETIAHLRELDAARTQGTWFAWDRGVGWHLALDPDGDHLLPEGMRTDLGHSADAEFIAGAANHMGALLDAAEERDKLQAAWDAHDTDCAAMEAEVSRLRAELAGARALIERVTALADEYERRGEYGDASLTWGARDIRAALAPVTQREEGE
jgi:hypothetical protein